MVIKQAARPRARRDMGILKPVGFHFKLKKSGQSSITLSQRYSVLLRVLAPYITRFKFGTWINLFAKYKTIISIDEKFVYHLHIDRYHQDLNLKISLCLRLVIRNRVTDTTYEILRMYIGHCRYLPALSITETQL